jgi:putative ABC transport system permease protein
LKSELLASGYLKNISRSMGSVTSDYGGTTAVNWKGKAHGSKPLLMSNLITHDYGKTLGWKLLAGRDFSEEFGTDSSAMVINQSAAKLMGFKNPVDEMVKLNNTEYRVIGVVDDIIKFSPFDAIKPSVFTINPAYTNTINIRIAPGVPVSAALAKMEPIFRKYDPESPFEYKFVDEEYGNKFYTEARVARLAGFFAALAIFISCLGLFGLASYVAEQRTREIGVRKVLGATVVSVWKLLSKDFVLLVVISMFVATPLAWYFMNSWLENYEYRISVSWWVFGVTGFGVLFLTLVMVSYQSIKVALVNPVRTLRSE